jgi:SAM-dependent methyltransferase
MTPLSNALLDASQANMMEPFYPLHAYLCHQCFLVQLDQFEAPPQIFGDDYSYLSSYSQTWLDHARRYAQDMIRNFGFDSRSQVIEIGSNDGYLLQYFKEYGVPVLGIEPAKNVADLAIGKGIPTISKFFGIDTASKLAAEDMRADLLLANNVLAHTPELSDFVKAMKMVLKPDGILTVEVPHLFRLIEQNQFDTIYHEHFSYFSFLVLLELFSRSDLQIFDVEELPTHGGSLRVYARHSGKVAAPSARVAELADRERRLGYQKLETYQAFSKNVERSKWRMLEFMISLKREGKTIVGYGAPAKGNTLLNYCGIGPDLLAFTVDRSPRKQGKFLPGSHIPVYAPQRIDETRPDYILILPWNLKDEIMKQLEHVRSWGGQFVIPIPEVKVLS